MWYEKQDLFLMILWAVMVAPNLNDIDKALGMSLVWFALVWGVMKMRGD